jgi:CCR4-NOT transcription complex subunit 6
VRLTSFSGPEPPAERDWIILDENADSTDDSSKFSLLSFNILCDAYVNPSHYGFVPQEVLNWDYRKTLILDEIRERNADVVCLQECNAEAFNDYFRPMLAHNDYKGLFWQKSRSRTMSEKEARLVDGCATFYKNSR